MFRIRTMRFPCLAVLAGAVVLSGCGESVIKDDELTSGIKKQYEAKTGVNLKSIECDKTKAEEGAAISCKAVNDAGIDLEFTGEVVGKEGDGDNWGFNWNLDKAYAPAALFEDSASQTITQQLNFEVASVDCPDRLLLEAGTEAKCEVTGTDGTTKEATLRLTDGEGGFRVSLE